MNVVWFKRDLRCYACSRLSPHLAWGTISMKDAFQRTRDRQNALRADKGRDSRWLQSLSSFQGRLRWHCHFIQKLEDERELEFQNMCRVYDGIREDSFRKSHFDAWCAGQTGYPMVDACMRALHTRSSFRRALEKFKPKGVGIVMGVLTVMEARAKPLSKISLLWNDSAVAFSIKAAAGNFRFLRVSSKKEFKLNIGRDAGRIYHALGEDFVRDCGDLGLHWQLSGTLSFKVRFAEPSKALATYGDKLRDAFADLLDSVDAHGEEPNAAPLASDVEAPL